MNNQNKIDRELQSFFSCFVFNSIKVLPRLGLFISGLIKKRGGEREGNGLLERDVLTSLLQIMNLFWK